MKEISSLLRISEQIQVIQREDLLKFRGAENMQTNLSQEAFDRAAVPVKVDSVKSSLCSFTLHSIFQAHLTLSVQYLIIFKSVMHIFYFLSKGQDIKKILFLLFFKYTKAWIFLLQIENQDCISMI